MKITIVAIGKKHDPRLLSAIEDYTARINRYSHIDWKPLEAKVTPSMSENEIRSEESKVLMESIRPDDCVILLDERGKQLSSPQLAKQLQNYMNQSVRSLVIIIGGAYGVSEELLKKADFTWSLSTLVFPHQLVRLILAEQLYRAHTILAGEKYHHS